MIFSVYDLFPPPQACQEKAGIISWETLLPSPSFKSINLVQMPTYHLAITLGREVHGWAEWLWRWKTISDKSSWLKKHQQWPNQGKGWLSQMERGAESNINSPCTISCISKLSEQLTADAQSHLLRSSGTCFIHHQHLLLLTCSLQTLSVWFPHCHSPKSFCSRHQGPTLGDILRLFFYLHLACPLSIIQRGWRCLLPVWLWWRHTLPVLFLPVQLFLLKTFSLAVVVPLLSHVWLFAIPWTIAL